MNARDRILAKVRQQQHDHDVLHVINQHHLGPQPNLPENPDDLLKLFVEKACALSSTVSHASSITQLPHELARYISQHDLSNRGICWPEFSSLPWVTHGLWIENCLAVNEAGALIGLTGTFCAVAETGTLVLVSSAQTPITTALLPDTHIAMVKRNRIVPTMETAFKLIRREYGFFPRSVNFISGPSRTADIAQTLVLGAHGPYRVHIILLG